MTSPIKFMFLAMLCVGVSNAAICNTEQSFWCTLKELPCSATNIQIHAGTNDFIDRAIADILTKLEPVFKLSGDTTVDKLVNKIPDLLRMIPDIRDRVTGVICRFQSMARNSSIESEEDDSSPVSTHQSITTTSRSTTLPSTAVTNTTHEPRTTTDAVTATDVETTTDVTTTDVTTTDVTTTDVTTTADVTSTDVTTTDVTTTDVTTTDVTTADVVTTTTDAVTTISEAQPSTVIDSTYTEAQNPVEPELTNISEQNRGTSGAEKTSGNNNDFVAPAAGSSAGIILVALVTLYVLRKMNPRAKVTLSDNPSFDNPIYDGQIPENKYETPIPYAESTYTNPVTYDNYHTIDEHDNNNYHNLNAADPEEPVYDLGTNNPAQPVEPIYSMGDELNNY